VRKDSYLHFRVTESERQKAQHLAEITGMSTSDLLRSLLQSAELQKVERLAPVARLSREQVQ
jgi:antitoxin component of RelBE/YafQ-DinJ toxin-antitoxin module